MKRQMCPQYGHIHKLDAQSPCSLFWIVTHALVSEHRIRIHVARARAPKIVIGRSPNGERFQQLSCNFLSMQRTFLHNIQFNLVSRPIEGLNQREKMDLIDPIKIQHITPILPGMVSIALTTLLTCCIFVEHNTQNITLERVPRGRMSTMLNIAVHDTLRIHG